jgi:hypothetical protein
MALVERPRNNLQEQLAWFNAQKPQVPPLGQNTALSTVLTNVQATALTSIPQPRTFQPSAASSQPPATMPVPTNMRSSTLVAPRRSDVNIRRQDIQDIQVISTHTVPEVSTDVSRKSVVERSRHDVSRDGLNGVNLD